MLACLDQEVDSVEDSEEDLVVASGVASGVVSEVASAVDSGVVVALDGTFQIEICTRTILVQTNRLVVVV